jgi:hypothetical protein
LDRGGAGYHTPQRSSLKRKGSSKNRLRNEDESNVTSPHNSLGRSPGRSKSGKSRKDKSRERGKGGDDVSDEDEDMPLANVALAALQNNLASKRQ